MILFNWILGAVVIFGLCAVKFPISVIIGILVVFSVLLFCKGKNNQERCLYILDDYAQRSRLCYMAASYKVWLTIVIMMIGLLSEASLACTFIGASMAYITIYLGGIPWRRYVQFLSLPLVFVLLSQLAIVYQFSNTPLGYWDIGIKGIYIAITPLSQQNGWVLLSKALCGLGCLYFISLTTPMAGIIGVLKRVRVPAIMIELMYLIYRYIFILLHIQSQMHIAADARLGHRNVSGQWRSFKGISSNLLALAFYRARICFDAMEARGYDGRLEFLEPEQYRPSVKQWVCYIAYLLGIVGFILIEKR